MLDEELSATQITLIESPQESKIFLEGPAGCGKTTAAVARLQRILEAGVPGDSILLMVPQRTLANPYIQTLRQPNFPSGGVVAILTLGGLARRMIDLFWPLVIDSAGFGHVDELPTFLTLETAQYYMAHLVRPLLEQGLFDSVVIDRNRLYSQILDNLNKAALVGFPSTEIGQRLKDAWGGEPGQLRVYDDTQTCANLFREFCLENNLLDFSLQIEIFRERLWPSTECRNYLVGSYRHLIYDNIEEDTPASHDLVRAWLPDFESALLVYDWDAGYRRFLGADPDNAYGLKDLCSTAVVCEDSFVASPQIQSLSVHLSSVLVGVGEKTIASQSTLTSTQQQNSELPPPRPALEYSYHRFYPQMLDWVAEQIASLVFDQGVPAGEIVILAPFLSDALRFSLVHRLQEREIPARSHRPSRSLREEPATQCLLTLAAMANPDWNVRPSKFEIAYALVQAVDELDLVRAQLLTEIVYRIRDSVPTLTSFDQIVPDVQERITYRLGERFERLRLWLLDAQSTPQEFDHFLGRLFGELLSQPGYGFHNDYDAGQVSANLIESVQKFRWVAGDVLAVKEIPLGAEYLAMVQDGVIAAQYLRGWQIVAEESVLLAPAYTFLMGNRPVDAQFWLDIGSRGWFERLNQPLTHPYVLSRNWPPGRMWTDLDEIQTGNESMNRLVIGLLRRCRYKVYLGLSELGEQGYKHRGPLLQAFQRVLRNTSDLEYELDSSNR